MEAPAVPNLTAPRPTPPGRRDLATLPKAHLRIVDGAYHELLNEPEGPGLIRDIIIWLGEH